MGKKRLDVLLTEYGHAPSRERAKSMIMEGIVFVSGSREDKAGTMIDEEKVPEIEIRGEKLPFVSRGGLKLQKAFEIWPLRIDGLVCLDIGASTGGFTDCMLRHGAKRVYAVDVGYGQLAYTLRTDERVIVMEKTNFRYVTKQEIPEEIGFASADVSFISLSKIFPAAVKLLSEDAWMTVLIKPQFEAGREHVGKKGVVRDRSVHEEVIRNVCSCARENGLAVRGLDFSPVRGPEGNIEYLLLLQNGEEDAPLGDTVKETVSRAHEAWQI